MDEYMDVIGLSMNTTDKKSFCISESVFHDEQSIQTLKSDYLKTNQKNLGKKSLQSSQNTEEPESSSKDIGLFNLSSYCHLINNYFYCNTSSHFL